MKLFKLTSLFDVLTWTMIFEEGYLFCKYHSYWAFLLILPAAVFSSFHDYYLLKENGHES